MLLLAPWAAPAGANRVASVRGSAGNPDPPRRAALR